MHDRLYDKLCDILDEMEQKNNLSASDIQVVDWATHAKKSMLAVDEMTGGGYSNGYSGRRYGGSYDGSYDDGSYRGNSYARGRGRNAKRDSMGRYARDGRSYRGYSRDSKEDFIAEMHEMMESAPDESTRQSIQRMLSQMEQD